MLYNKRNLDGSVNSYQETGIPGTGYTVPFSDSNFLDQIEENIKAAVFELNVKGYPTITSCHGHGVINYIFNDGVDINLGPSITIKISKSLAPVLKNHFNSFFIKTVINDSMEEFEDTVNLRIITRTLVSPFVTNKFLCKQIELLVKQL